VNNSEGKLIASISGIRYFDRRKEKSAIYEGEKERERERKREIM